MVLLFLIIPIVEMYLLIEVAQRIDVMPTVGLVMLTAVVGVAMLRQQGLSTLTRGMSRLNQGELPAKEVFEGLLLAVAGAFLITPGFLTDSIGFMLAIGPARQYLAVTLLHRFQFRSMSGFTSESTQGKHAGERNAGKNPSVIEGEFKEKK